MFADFFAKWATQLIIGAIIAALVGGGALYVKHLYTQNGELKTANAQLQKDNKKLTEVMKNDLKVDAETEKQQERIERLNPTDLAAEWERLRQYKRAQDANPASE